MCRQTTFTTGYTQHGAVTAVTVPNHVASSQHGRRRNCCNRYYNMIGLELDVLAIMFALRLAINYCNMKPVAPALINVVSGLLISETILNCTFLISDCSNH